MKQAAKPPDHALNVAQKKSRIVVDAALLISLPSSHTACVRRGVFRFWKVGRVYFAMRSCESCVPICWNVVMIWFAVVSITKREESVAQFCSKVESGSPPVLTWMA